MTDPAAHWDDRYRRYDGPEAPSSILIEHEAFVPTTGSALDLAGGSGRNALWLAARGLQTTLVDVSTVALAIATRRAKSAGLSLDVLACDLEASGPPQGDWDVVVITNFWNARVLSDAVGRLASGGVLLFSQPTVTNLERHDRPGRHHLPATGEVAALAATFADVEVLRCDEAWRAGGRHEVHLLLRRIC